MLLRAWADDQHYLYVGDQGRGKDKPPGSTPTGTPRYSVLTLCERDDNVAEHTGAYLAD